MIRVRRDRRVVWGESHFAWVVVAVATMAACSSRTRSNPDFCKSDGDCKTPTPHCDVHKTYKCVANPGGTGTGGAVAGTGGAGQTGGSGSTATGGAGVATGGAPVGGASGGGGISPGTGGTSAGGAVASGGTPGSGGRATGTGGMPGTGGAGTGGMMGCPPCSGATQFCDMTTKMCVGCLQNSQCNGTKPICSTTSKTCVGCTGNQCATATPTTPVCRSDGSCVVCNVKADCASTPATPVCLDSKCVACAASSDCPDAKPICDMNHACVACTGDGQCLARNPATPACITTAGAGQGTCVACTAHTTCTTATKPVCIANVCAACTSDKQCVEKSGADPGVCMFHTDGHCATSTEVLYVKPDSSCTDSGTGAAGAPFCDPQLAINAATTTKNVVVIRKGTAPVTKWAFGGTTPISVIGQGGATIGSATASTAGVGISVTAGSVYVRGLGVTNMIGVGVSVASGATLKLDGCVVTMNQGGGLVVNGGGFEIDNSVFASNAGTSTPAAFGGVYLRAGAGTPAQFRNNTIYANAGFGLVCDGAYPVHGLLVANNSGGQVSMCDFADTSSFVPGPTTVDPHFDATPGREYHLTAASPCVDVGNTTDFSTHDLDGNPRPSPANGRPDCGAHELQK